MNVERLICGFAVVFDEKSRDGRPPHRREDFEALDGFDVALPLMVNHEIAMVLSSGQVFVAVGRTLEFVIVNGDPPVPHGVLCMAEFDEGTAGDAALSAAARGQFGGLSRGGDGNQEVSLAHQPAFANCRIVGMGVEALTAWELLTGKAKR